MITKSKAIETATGDLKAAETFAHEKTVEGIKQGAATAAAGMEQAQVQVKEGMQRVMKTAEQMTTFSQGNMEAFKAMTSVKSVKEAFELQSSFAKASMEKAMAESGKLTEQSMKLAEQAFAPISARVNAAVETFS